MQREETISRLRHPETIVLMDGGRSLIDDPVADRLANGDPLLGWEGDPRLALYVNPQRGKWELWRLEHDGQYRITLTEPGEVRGHDVVPRMILRLLAMDTRRGVKVIDVVRESYDAAERASDAAHTERVTELADRLAHGLRKDGVVD